MLHPHIPQLLFYPLRHPLAHRAFAQAGADEGAAEDALGARRVYTLETFKSDRVVDEYRIEVGVRAQLQSIVGASLLAPGPGLSAAFSPQADLFRQQGVGFQSGLGDDGDIPYPRAELR